MLLKILSLSIYISFYICCFWRCFFSLFLWTLHWLHLVFCTSDLMGRVTSNFRVNHNTFLLTTWIVGELTRVSWLWIIQQRCISAWTPQAEGISYFVAYHWRCAMCFRNKLHMYYFESKYYSNISINTSPSIKRSNIYPWVWLYLLDYHLIQKLKPLGSRPKSYIMLSNNIDL